MSVSQVTRIIKIVRDDNLVEDSLDVIYGIRPEWFTEKNNYGEVIKSKVFTGGIMNKLMGFSLPSNPKDVVMVKVYGSNTELMVDRQAEIDTMILLHKHQCGPQLYALFDNGMSYEFIPGATLTKESCRSPQVFPLVAAEMARLHKTIPLIPKVGEFKVKSAMWKTMQNFYELNVDILRTNSTLASRLRNEYGYSAVIVKQNYDEMRTILEKEAIPVAFCHNDVLLGNVIYNEEANKVSFIDFEYAMPNYVAFDVANHFNEMAGIDNPDFSLCPGQEFGSKWITEYLKSFGVGGFTQTQFGRWVDICIPVSHLFWAMWAVVQAHNSTIDFSYTSYAGLRYIEYKKHMEELRGKI